MEGLKRFFKRVGIFLLGLAGGVVLVVIALKVFLRPNVTEKDIEDIERTIDTFYKEKKKNNEIKDRVGKQIACQKEASRIRKERSQKIEEEGRRRDEKASEFFDLGGR